MDGMRFNEFYDTLFHGTDMDIEIGGDYYFIQTGILDNNQFEITVMSCSNPSWEKWTEAPVEIYRHKSVKVTDVIDKFLDEKLFEGKSIMDLQQEVRVLTN